MMQQNFGDFFYPHSCKVKRDLGSFDENGDPNMEIIYEGLCGYQIGNSGYTTGGIVIQNSPNVILPSNEAIFKANDLVEIEVEKDRVIQATVESFEDVDMDEIGGTTLWLKNGTV